MFATKPLAKVRLRNFPGLFAWRDKLAPILCRMARRYRGKRLALLSAAMALPAMAAPAEFAELRHGAPAVEDAAVQPEQPITPEVQAPTAESMRAQDCLAMALFYEANTESDAGQRAVAQVILNRVAHRHYPDSVCGVVFQGSHRQTGCQFSFACDGSLERHKPNGRSWRRVSRIAREALAGSVYRPVGLATHYHTTRVTPYWAPSLQRVGMVGRHLFYRKSGKSGAPGAYDFSHFGGEPPVALRQAAAVQAQLDTVPEAPARTDAIEAGSIAATGSEKASVAAGDTQAGVGDTLRKGSRAQPEIAQGDLSLADGAEAKTLPAT